MTIDGLMTWAALANAASTAASSPASWMKAMLSGRVPDRRRAGRDRIRGRRHGGQRLVVDLDQLGGVLGLVERLGHHEGDRIADIAHPVAGQHGCGATKPGARRGACAARAGADAERRHLGIVAGQHQQHAGLRARRRRVDRGGCGHGRAASAAHRRAPAPPVHVVDIAAAPRSRYGSSSRGTGCPIPNSPMVDSGAHTSYFVAKASAARSSPRSEPTATKL